MTSSSITTIHSRDTAVAVPCPGCMLPFLDLMNHQPRARVSWIYDHTRALDRVPGRRWLSFRTDRDVRAALRKKKFEHAELEWMRCTVADVKTVLAELRTGKTLTGTHHETFAMRREQADAGSHQQDRFAMAVLILKELQSMAAF